VTDYTSTYFDEYVPGTVRTFVGRTITAEDIRIHADQTGDHFPHHTDAEWCATQPFGRPMAHGTLVLSVAVGMTATDINPASMSYGYDRIRFVRPVFVDDTISVRAEITTLRDHRKAPERYGLVEEELQVVNQNDEVVLALVHIYLVEKSDPTSNNPRTQGGTQ
jgi:acyl dehydratase